MTRKTRLYKVTTPTATRLIEASSRQAAIAHAARREIIAAIPPQHEVYALAGQGVEIEIAGAGVVSDGTRAALAQSCIEA